MKMRLSLLAILAVAACGDRPDVYDARVKRPLPSFGLQSDVVLVDDGAHRAVLLSPHSGQELSRRSIRIGKNVVRSDVSHDGKRLFVLSAGDVVRKKDRDEKPSLTVIEDGASKEYVLAAPHSGLAIDKEGRWAALFAAPTGSAQAAFVENPNEIVLVDLAADASAAVTPRTIRSFGGRPQRVSFTPTLSLPGGPRRLLVVETEQDITLLDLDNVRSTPQRPEITVRLTSGASAAVSAPSGVVFDDGDADKRDDSRIGVRLKGSPNVVTLTLAPQDPEAKSEDPNSVPNDFRPIVNLTDVGGEPGDVVFVRTDVGIRLAAIVPSTRRAVLVDPATSITTNVDLPDTYSKISLITNVVAGASGTDTALLYGPGGARGVAFWSLGRATGQPYRSVEVVSLSTAVDRVEDVPPPRPQLKVLSSTSANAFYVLDLLTRTASPLATLSAPSLAISRDGERIWAFQKGAASLAQVLLADLHPTPVPLDRSIDAVFDVARRDGGRALVAIDARGAVGATVLDAVLPDTARSRSYYGLLLEDLP